MLWERHTVSQVAEMRGDFRWRGSVLPPRISTIGYVLHAYSAAEKNTRGQTCLLATKNKENVMIPVINRTVARGATRVALVLGIFILCAAEASAVNGNVRSACEADYLAYCSRHDPDGAGVRQCMRAIGRKLSRGCVNALIDAGEVSAQEVARRARTGR